MCHNDKLCDRSGRTDAVNTEWKTPAVRSGDWLGELEAALRRLAKLRAGNAKTMDAQSWKEMHEAGELLSKAWNRERRRSPSVRVSEPAGGEEHQ